MTTNSGIAKWQMAVLWAALLLYALSRICQQYPDKISVQLIVAMQVVPLANFALVHGSILYGARGMAVFTAFCLGAGALCESLSLRTGFPFGHYYFTSLMGPKVIQVPILLVLAYLGIGYCSWVLSLLILGHRNKPITGTGVIAIPVLASFIMLAWDLSMESIWSTIDRAWIWLDRGSFFGVPITNFLGWLFTAFLFYQSFALFCRANPFPRSLSLASFWRLPILCYAVCAYGNLFIFRRGLFPPTVTDAPGRTWLTADILVACSLVSILVMGPIALFAWHRLKLQEAEQHER
jgi:uncharacterized membrane protein